MKKTFKTTIVREGSMCFIPVPFDPKPIFGKVRAPVRVSLNGHIYRSTIASMGNGPCVPLRLSNREAAGLVGGETLKVTLDLDTDKRKVKPPADFVKALAARPPKAASTRRYAAFLRGVSPMNAKMPELKKCLESAGFTDVKTVLSSGNVVFNARAASETSLARKVEAAMKARLGRTFMTIVRSVDALREMLDSDPYAAFRLSSGAKRVVTFMREEREWKTALPIELDGARILCIKGPQVFSAYVPSPRGPVFMTLIERAFGQDVTTRTWDTVKKVSIV